MLPAWALIPVCLSGNQQVNFGHLTDGTNRNSYVFLSGLTLCHLIPLSAVVLRSFDVLGRFEVISS